MYFIGHVEKGASTSSTIKVQASKRGAGRDYTKQHACVFCNKLSTKISRHLCMMHKDEREIASLPDVPKNKTSQSGRDTLKKRALELDKLRNMGDFHHNLNVLLDKRGILLLGRLAMRDYVHRPDDYLPCKYCLVFYYKKELWRHAKKCSFRNMPLDSERKTSKCMIEAGKLLLQGAGVKLSGCDLDPDFLQLVLGSMQKDRTSIAVKSDPLILLLGKTLFTKLGRMRAGDVRSRLRNLARIKLELRKVCNIPEASIGDLIRPDLYDHCIEATRSLCGVADETNLNGAMMFAKPSLALKVGHLLRKVATMKRGQAIRQSDQKGKADVDDFLNLHEAEWGDKIGSLARQTLSQRKFNRKEILPLTNDLVKLKVII